MHKLSKASQKELDTCVAHWYVIIMILLRLIDVKVTCGFRGEDQQNTEYAEGDSTKKWPESKHNKLPSPAIDIHPYPIDFEDRDRYVHMAGMVIAIGALVGVEIRWGGKWRKDVDIKDNKKVTGLDDLGHFEIVGLIND